eukprot:TRINITY_DN111712_c0_g1_i1.p1 TRINITY_DN111712_c0_g1~~TRINITY_DN111712_c0_g1_i1.p1  ORF type:complete len:525 (-),score=149.93 TRINITY_DN111712_c0_g1_i1:209-1783(-)
MRYAGSVKQFNTTTGFGFIASPKVAQEYGGVDCYVHANAVVLSNIDPSQMVPGTQVSFEVHVSGSGKPQASNIMILGAGGPQGGKSGGKAGGKQSGGKGGGDGPYGKGAPSKPPGPTVGHARPAGLAATVVSAGGTQRIASGPGAVAATVAALTKGKGKAPVSVAGGKGGKDKSSNNGKGGKTTKGSSKPSAPAVDVIQASKKAEEAVKEAVGDMATAKVLGVQSDDGSLQVIVSINTLNNLLKAAGFPMIEGSEEVPEDGEALPGFDGNKVEGGPWFTGTVREYLADQAYGIVDSEDFKEQFGDKECFVHGDHIDPEGTGELVADVGDEILFPLVEDEEGNQWAWSPVIPKKRNFFGKIESWHGTYGYIKCDTLWPVFEHHVYLHSVAADMGGVKPAVGTPVVFQLHVNATGKPQASAPHPPGLEPSQKFSDPPPAKRSKLPANLPVPAEDGRWYEGAVKSFNHDKGFGFLECAETHAEYSRDVFMHHTVANEAGAVKPGMPVEFQLQFGAEGHPQASRVKLK